MLSKDFHIDRTTAVSFFLASIGFVWQVNSVSKVYFNYETQVDILIDVPYKISMPGLTLCLVIQVDKALVNKYRPQSEHNYDDPSSQLAFLPINVVAQQTINHSSVRCYVPAIELPRLNKSGGSTCENIVEPRITIQYLFPSGKLNRCTTYFYRKPGDPLTEVILDNAKDFYMLHITSQKNETVAFFIHDPSEVVHVSDADTVSFTTDQLQETALSVSKFVTYLLPPPYRTGCSTYEGIEYGRWGCIYKCWYRKTQEKCPVWPIRAPAEVDVTQPFLLDHPECHLGDGERNECFSECNQVECENSWYTTITMYTWERKRYAANPYSTRIFVRRPIGVEIIYVYRPRLAGIEYICYIASSFGLWFGISFTDCFKMLYNLATDYYERSNLHRSRLLQPLGIPSKSMKLGSIVPVSMAYPAWKRKRKKWQWRERYNRNKVSWVQVEPMVMDQYYAKTVWR